MASQTKKITTLLSIVLFAAGCSNPQPGPDKSLGGITLGSMWGAGAGAIVGHQVAALGPGLAIGAGFGAVHGMITGIGLDMAEGTELAQQREIDALKVHVAANQRALLRVQNILDDRQQRLALSAGTTQIFFDPGRASLRSGSAQQLERIAQSIKLNPFVGSIELHGHSDDTGDIEENQRLSEARARTVATFLSNQGISFDRMRTIAHGTKSPLASNENEPGKQLNRRVEIVLVN